MSSTSANSAASTRHTADWPALAARVRNLAAPRVLIVGDVMLDWYITGRIDRISPEAPVPVLHVVQERETAQLGGAANVASNVRALGGVPLLVGVVGSDEPGQFTTEWFRKLCAAKRIRTRGLVQVAGRPTTLKTRIVGLAQNRIPQQMMRIDREDTSPLTDETLNAIEDALLAELGEADVVCFEDYRKGVLAPQRLPGWIAKVRDGGKAALVDPAPIADWSRYAGASVITPNRKEASLAVEAAIESPADAARLVPALLEKHRIEAAAVTLDRDGVVIVSADTSQPAIHVPTTPVDVYDVTGAGDSVLAAIAIALAGGWTMKDAASLANVVGGLEVSRFGCVAITRDEVLDELARRGPHAGKLLPRDALVAELARRRQAGQSIVFTNGCFDLLHPGHLQYLAICRQQGDVVVVGLNSDASVRRQGKRGDRPINAEADRAAMLAGLGDVDFVTIFDEDTPAELIDAVQPDVLVKGADWAERGVVGQDVVEARGGKVVLADLKDGYSTTELIDRIAASHRAE